MIARDKNRGSFVFCEKFAGRLEMCAMRMYSYLWSVRAFAPQASYRRM